MPIITAPNGQSVTYTGAGTIEFAAPQPVQALNPEMYFPTTSEAYIGINGVNVWGSIKEYVTEVEYIDCASGETDSLDLTLIDKDGHFMTDWLIDKGTEINGKIKLQNWNEYGDELWIDCGTFLCDALRLSGMPWEVIIRALALPVHGTEHTQKWENISISEIAKEICGRLGCELEFSAADAVLKSRQQSRKKDVEFLFSLCREYGLGMKVFRNKVTIFNREERDAAPAVATIDISKLNTETDEFITLEDNEEGTYTGAQCNYKLEGNDTEYTETYGTDERMIILDTTANSAAEAQLKARAAVYDANMEAVKLKYTALGGREPVYAGNNYYYEGLGGYSGKYAVDKVTYVQSGNRSYTLKVEAHGVELIKDNKQG